MIREGSEEMHGIGWTEAEGPFFIFKDQHGKVRWVFGNKSTSEVEWDDGTKINVHTDADMQDAHWNSVETHGPLMYSANMRNIKRPRRADYINGIQGRVWEDGGKLYAGFWNSATTLKRFTGFIPAFTEMVKEWFPNKRPDEIFINPNSPPSREEYVPLSAFSQSRLGKGKSQADIAKQHQLHLLSPDLKKAALQAMGAKSKTATHPDWQKKAAAGIDESMMLGEIAKQIIQEGKASSFLKFYHDEQRYGDVDDAVLFDCLTTLKEYYEDYLEWYKTTFWSRSVLKRGKLRVGEEKIIVDFKKRLQEIKIALDSDDKKRKIIAIDNGINQWHYDFPVVFHMKLHVERDVEDDEPTSPANIEMNRWIEVGDLLIKLGKLPRHSPYGPKGKDDYEWK
jgi:hypothetical protein